MEKIVNMRDLGGLINQQGQQIITNKLFRAGNPSVANEADRARLQQLTIEQFIDFRSDNEKRSSEQVFAKSFNWIAQPIFTGDLSGLLGEHLSKAKALEVMYDIYRRFPVEFQSQFHYLLKQAEQGKTLLYHCTAGKDRTGFASLLLLTALGVEFDKILEDYLYSNHAVAGLKAQMADFMDDNIDHEALNIILEVAPEYLDNSLQVINRSYGGVDKYLTNTLGIDVRAIRQHYLCD